MQPDKVICLDRSEDQVDDKIIRLEKNLADFP